MNKKIILLSTLVLLSFSNQSCSEDFIDVKPTEAISAQDLSLFNNNEGAESFVTAIYAKFLDWNMSTFAWIGVSSITSDDADKGSTPGDTGADKDVLDALTFNATTPSFKDLFAAQYQGINRCNQALVYLPQLTNADSALRNRLAGEARFLRAFIYFTLVRTYGGVPIVDRLSIPGNDEDRKMLLTRRSKEEVYAFIEADLQAAIAALPDKSAYTGTNVGRASKGAAYALLAKVSMYQKKWQEVVNNCNLVTGYSLTDDFAEIYKVSGENNAESIFEIQGKGEAPGKGIQQYSQVQGATGAGGWGWGFNGPSQGLVDAFNAEGDTERRNATVIFRNSTLYDGRIVPATVNNPYYNFKAYSSNYSGADHSDVNIRYLRFSEVLLMKAEALNELGQTPQAILLLNQVRDRANINPTSAVSQSDVRVAIWKERRLELAFEHDRWYDLVRTGQAQAAMAADGKTFVVGKHELFPLPQSFIDEAQGLSSQNPGGY